MSFVEQMNSEETTKLLPKFMNVKLDNDEKTWKKLQKFMNSLWPKEIPGLKYPDIVQGCDINLLKDQNNFIHLGSGVQGDVYLGHHLPSNKYTAVKFFHKGHDSVRNIFRESCCLEIGSTTGGSAYFFGISYLQTNEKYHRFAIVTEFIGDETTFQSTNFNDILSDKVLCDRDILHHILQIIKSVYSLHMAGLVISDLKFDNCLFDKHSKTWKVIDMGMSVIEGIIVNYAHTYGLKVREDYQKFLTTYKQIAPETVYFGHLGKKSDVFRIGRILEFAYSYRKDMKNSLGPVARECLKPIECRPTLSQVYQYLKSVVNNVEIK